ncbi:hypothetical protein SDC9_48095 [bioreactor metagenome]|uniref:Uncharacterized protein n=1 Tax=bioreactor metagenome TaxID=1076179 RepID=A0A644WDE2_9ZZZZ
MIEFEPFRHFDCKAWICLAYFSFLIDNLGGYLRPFYYNAPGYRQSSAVVTGRKFVTAGFQRGKPVLGGGAVNIAYKTVGIGTVVGDYSKPDIRGA